MEKFDRKTNSPRREEFRSGMQGEEKYEDPREALRRAIANLGKVVKEGSDAKKSKKRSPQYDDTPPTKEQRFLTNRMVDGTREALEAEENDTEDRTE